MFSLHPCCDHSPRRESNWSPGTPSSRTGGGDAADGVVRSCEVIRHMIADDLVGLPTLLYFVAVWGARISPHISDAGFALPSPEGSPQSAVSRWLTSRDRIRWAAGGWRG